jgi:hypothetical protein
VRTKTVHTGGLVTTVELSRRTLISFIQYLVLQPSSVVSSLFQKHGLPPVEIESYRGREEVVGEALHGVTSEQLDSLFAEIARTQGNLRYAVSPRYLYDERWEDLLSCLELDGHRLEDKRLIPIDPTIQGSAPVEDDLSSAVGQSGLPESGDVLRLMETSAEAFRRRPPDYNGCLANARVALETVGRGVAKARWPRHPTPSPFDEKSWGSTLAYLRQSGFLTEEEEKGLAGLYRFVSPGAHTPLGFTDEESVRLGRSLAAFGSYFLVKRFNATP